MVFRVLWTVLRARRSGLLHLRLAEGAMRLDCLGGRCAVCCELLGSPLVREGELEGFGAENVVQRGGAVFAKSCSGRCIMLSKGLCSIYQNRPAGCREYPFYNIDGRLYYDAGCPGVRFDRDERPAVEDITRFEQFFPGVPGFAVKLIKWICLH